MGRPPGLLMNQVGYRMLPKDMKEILMLQAMLDCQEELCDLMGVPRGLEGVQEASIGMVKEAAELIEEVHPGSRAWRKIDYEAADKEAIDVLLYLLEYFVLRGYDAEEILQLYYAKAEVVTERQISKVAADKVPDAESLGDLSRELLEGEQLIVGIFIEETNEALRTLGSLDTLHELDALPDGELLSDSGVQSPTWPELPEDAFGGAGE